jgi:hypothetical protein
MRKYPAEAVAGALDRRWHMGGRTISMAAFQEFVVCAGQHMNQEG